MGDFQDPGPTHCSNCARPLPERGAGCPMCVPRWGILRRLFGLLEQHRLKLILVAAATFVAVAAQMAPPYLTKRIVYYLPRIERILNMEIKPGYYYWDVVTDRGPHQFIMSSPNPHIGRDKPTRYILRDAVGNACKIPVVPRLSLPTTIT